MELRALQLGTDEPRAAARAVAYHRIVVPVVEGSATERALATACKLAAERDSSISALSVIEVPAELPMDAHMIDEEAAAQRILARARVIAELYGVSIDTRVVRAREAGDAIVDAARLAGADLIVLRPARRRGRSRQAAIFGRTARIVLEHAPCRVLITTAATR